LGQKIFKGAGFATTVDIGIHKKNKKYSFLGQYLLFGGKIFYTGANTY